MDVLDGIVLINILAHLDSSVREIYGEHPHANANTRIPRYFVLTKQLLTLEMLRLTLKISFISQVVILLFPLPTTKVSVILELHHWDTYAVAEVWVVKSKPTYDLILHFLPDFDLLQTPKWTRMLPIYIFNMPRYTTTFEYASAFFPA